MINSTFGGFMTARVGMAASQHGLNITGQNLTNSATEGYTRQRIDQISVNYSGTYRYASKYNTNIGNGVLVTGTSQLRDPFLDLRYRNEVAHVGEQDVKLSVLSDLQNILDEVGNAGEDSLGDGGIFNQLGDVLAKLQQLSNEVGNKEFDNMVKSSCQSLVTLFNSYSARIDEVKQNLEYDIQNVDVPRVNEILISIQDLNQTIKSGQIVGDSCLELKDQRNLLIDELSNYMKISVTTKPVQVSDSTVVDELYISMVGRDGNNYTIIADSQRREFILSEEENGNWNIALGALSPVDGDLKAALRTAKSNLEKATKAADKDLLKNNFTTAYNDFAAKVPEMKRLQDDAKAKNEAVEDAKEAFDEARTKYLAARVDDTKTPEEVQLLKEAKDTAEATYDAAKKAASDAEKAAKEYQEGYAKSYEAYEKARKALPSTLDGVNGNLGLKDIFGDTNNDGIVDDNDIPDALPLSNPPQKVVGGNGAADALEKAQNAYHTALENLELAEEAGKAVASINELLTDGKLKGELEMLNYSGEYDNPPNSIRGVGYFKNMLDTLANQFATMMNEANNPYTFTDENGKVVEHNLFASEDGQKITAGNITLAKGWVENEYSLTASKDPAAPVGANDNISHFIALFNNKENYIAQENLMPKTEITFAAGSNPTLEGMKPGDTVTIDGKTYTYVKGATGVNGIEFDIADHNSLKIAAAKNGSVVEVDQNTKKITAQTAEFDLKSMVTVNEDQISNLSNINLSKMEYGDTITIDGVTFTYRPEASIAEGPNEFHDFVSLQTKAADQNIQIEGSAATGKITSIKKIADKDLPVTVNKTPTLKDMKNGDTITIGDKTYTMGTGDDQFENAEELIALAKKDDINLYINENGEFTSATETGSKLFNGTFEEYFTNIGVTLGLDIQTTSGKLDSYSQLASSISESRDAITGVSLDEEAMNIMRYQQSYNASARLMTALDQMLDTLITGTGVVGR